MDKDLKVVRLFRLEGDSKVKAFVDVAIGEYVVKGLRLVEGKKGLFLAMPQERSKDGKYYHTFHPETEDAQKALEMTVMAAYQE